MDPIMKKGTPEGPLFSWVGGKTKGSIVRSGGPDDQEFSSAVFLVLGFGAGNPIAAFVEQFALAYPDRVDLLGGNTEVRQITCRGFGAALTELLVVAVRSAGIAVRAQLNLGQVTA